MTPDGSASAALLGLLLIVTFGYSLSCVLWPFKACRSCQGTGKLRSPFIRAIRLCSACGGTGLRPRLGLKAWNAYRRFYRNSRR